jgi:alkylation response protein AidB-like acyl-CoA dehydrogenase
MDFNLDEGERATVARFRELGREVEAAPAEQRLARLARGGALGLPLPREHGGEGASLVATALAYEALGREVSEAGVLLAAGAHLFGVALAIDRAGTAAQRARWLPKLASGEVVATVAATERGSGSDVARVEATATPTGSGFTFSGEKAYVTCAARAGLFFAVGKAVGRTRGLTVLLVPRDQRPEAAGHVEPGIEPRIEPRIRTGAPLPVLALEGAELAPVSFRGVELEHEAALGKPGAGLAVFQIAMTFERALVLAFRLGALERQLEEAIGFARRRTLGGFPIAKHQAVSHRIARMRLRVDTARLLVLRAAWLLDRRERALGEAALAKWHLAEVAVENALDAMRLRGGDAFVVGSGLDRAMAEAIGGTIHSGTADVLASIVAALHGLA